MNEVKFSDLIGKTLIEVRHINEEIIFETIDNEAFKLFHN